MSGGPSPRICVLVGAICALAFAALVARALVESAFLRSQGRGQDLRPVWVMVWGAEAITWAAKSLLDRHRPDVSRSVHGATSLVPERSHDRQDGPQQTLTQTLIDSRPTPEVATQIAM